MTSVTIPDTMHVRERLERLIPLFLVIGVLLAAILSITPWPVGAYEQPGITRALRER